MHTSLEQLWFVAVLLVAAACGGEEAAEPAVDDDLRKTAAFVGDDACASCHEDVYMSYHRTGMGRSVSTFDPASAPEVLPGDAVYHERSDFFYEAFVRGDTLFQREFRTDAAGGIVYERIHPVEWVIGSGNNTRSYLMNVNGHVSEMPLTWYVERRKWDLSPSYGQDNLRFSRPIVAECMTCHNGFAAHSEFTYDHYTDVPLGITCERCHGPGREHVDRRLAGLGPDEGEPDPTVVQPSALSRDLQLSICQQCHLTGTTVFKQGEGPLTFRPGKPLDDNRTVFAPKEHVEDPERFGIASHALRLERSVCFEQSEMTCTTCHDPHVPNAELGADHFNEACVGCHSPAADAGEFVVCGRESAHTLDEAMTGNCVGCHLQSGGTSDIPHVTFTDHWIRRRLPRARAPGDVERILVRPDPFRLVRVGVRDDEADRGTALLEEAAAYFAFYDESHAVAAYLDSVVVKARAGLDAGADLEEGRLALGRALLEQGRLPDAVSVLTDAAARYPKNARIHYWRGEAALRHGRPADAADHLQRAVEIQPAFTEARIKLGEALHASQRLSEAESAYRAALEEDPVHHPRAWNNLGYLYLQMERLDEADRMFERAIGLDPDLVIALVNAATIHIQNADWERALELLEHAVDRQPDFVPALGNLALVYRQLGRTEAAVRALEQLVRHRPDDRRARALLEQLRSSGSGGG